MVFSRANNDKQNYNVYTAEETVGIQHYGGMVVPPLKIPSLIQHEYESLIVRTHVLTNLTMT